MSAIKKVIASIEELHGSARDQAAKHDTFIAWQLRQRLEASGRTSSILKQVVDDPCDDVNGEAEEFRCKTMHRDDGRGRCIDCGEFV